MLHPLTALLLVGGRLEPGDPVGRDAAREAARRELSDSRYARNQPGLTQRLLDWLSRQLDRVLSRAVDAVPYGGYGLLLLLGLLVLVLVLVLRTVGPLRGRALRAAAEPDLAAAEDLTAADLRASAEAELARGEIAQAIRTRLRAVARQAEQRALVDFRPGRTPAELAADAGRALPAAAPALRRAADAFGEVWYGGRAATLERYRLVAEADDQLRSRGGRGAPAAELVDSGPVQPR